MGLINPINLMFSKLWAASPWAGQSRISIVWKTLGLLRHFHTFYQKHWDYWDTTPFWLPFQCKSLVLFSKTNVFVWKSLFYLTKPLISLKFNANHWNIKYKPWELTISLETFNISFESLNISLESFISLEILNISLESLNMR